MWSPEFVSSCELRLALLILSRHACDPGWSRPSVLQQKPLPKGLQPGEVPQPLRPPLARAFDAALKPRSTQNLVRRPTITSLFPRIGSPRPFFPRFHLR